MNLTVLAITADFILERATITWSEVLFGIDNRLLAPDAAVDLARARLSAQKAVSPEVVELAAMTRGEPTRDVVHKLAESEGPRDFALIRGKWLYLTLAWVFEHRHAYADPLQKVEAVYADFERPPEIESFVRHTAMAWPGLETKEANEQRLYDRWSEYLRMHRFATDLCGNEALAFVGKLRELGSDGERWETEYVDDSSGEIWVLYYPESGYHGGGFPRVRKKA
ncbi:hypothetical protein AKJ09_09343 [Labilithrix luteola]|uniref:Uncharacterized protein n=1 Tax=Labilithrix luteola TaxID=1391654 RepID=A0A0K1QB96_9BACT|nr:Imm27 family immunity protein [Labilithrix luteola]AKV02680.1 hypothetical protein AKJ09_09343 [Labilithrix luteola]